MLVHGTTGLEMAPLALPITQPWAPNAIIPTGSRVLLAGTWRSHASSNKEMIGPLLISAGHGHHSTEV
jgi:hypothetical protein